MSPPLDELTWHRLCASFLDQTGVGLAACDDGMRVLSCTGRAQRLLGLFGPAAPGAALPETIARAVQGHLLSTSRPNAGLTLPVRVDTSDGRGAVYVAAMRMPEFAPATVAVRVHEEIVRDTELLAVLRERFAISARDFQLINLLRLGYANKQIASSLGLADSTVRTYLSQLFEELGVHSRAELICLIDRVRSEK